MRPAFHPPQQRYPAYSPQRYTPVVSQGIAKGAVQDTFLPSSQPKAPAIEYSSRLRILYYNDPHEKLSLLPHLVTAFRQLTQEGFEKGMDVLRLSGGDNNVGVEAKDWKLNVKLMNLLQLHGTAMGNHELDQGSRNFTAGLNQANFDTMVSNLEIPKNTSFRQSIQNGHIDIDTKVVTGQGEPYGLLGVTTTDLDDVLSQSADIEGIDDEDWHDTLAIIQQQVRELQSQGVQRIILLSHLGYALEKKVAQSISGIDVIVGGHSHDVLWGVTSQGRYANYVLSPAGEPVMILQAGKDGRMFGELDVDFTPQGTIKPVSNNIFRFHKFAEAPDAVGLINQTLGPETQIATITTTYDNENIPFQEDALAEFAADAVRAYGQADIGFVRSSEIRNSIVPGAFTDRDLKTLMPFSDPIVTIKVEGDDIIEAYEESMVSLQKRDAHPGMLHPSGLQVVLNKTTGQIERMLVETKQGWEPLDEDKEYTVALGEYTVNNQNEYESISKPENIIWRGDKPLRDVMALGLKKAGAPARPIALKKDGRLVIK